PGDVTAPAYLEALETVRAAAARHGKACGLLAGDGAVARRLRGQGWRFVGIGSDSTLLAAALGTALAAARSKEETAGDCSAG
ncbi:MAG TPA: 2,4-dihydroxyhept-2-ene-1,7-dioic acid aldolase, partial [Actinomycetota bacterium]|nr:2,4-dihydroxyhept-2-ene-1,7-dioic acid aldolase [Actinomycetota bacterium]